MVKFKNDLDRTFYALADPTRRAIVDSLSKGDQNVSKLARPFEMTLPAIHKHLGILEDAGLIHCRKEGRVRTCTLDPRGLDVATSWIEKRRTLWAQRLDRLEAFLNTKGERHDQDDL